MARSDSHPELPVDPDTSTSPSTDRARRPESGAAHTRPALILAVAAGGLVGTPLRYGAELLWPARSGQWPVGTFVVNVVGAVLIGALLEGLARAGADTGWRRLARLGVGTGLLGAFTTYSSLSVEGDLLLADRWVLAVGYGVASVTAGLAAAAAGVGVAAGWHRRQARATRTPEPRTGGRR